MNVIDLDGCFWLACRCSGGFDVGNVAVSYMVRKANSIFMKTDLGFTNPDVAIVKDEEERFVTFLNRTERVKDCEFDYRFGVIWFRHGRSF